ncbi:hypothetical protein K438DRAFT_2136108 [Mycena galopus ATCC 62051]|nr:hypothetical protein K438DRAFT_2136108 [Mycena galopus ATCC 62051]
MEPDESGWIRRVSEMHGRNMVTKATQYKNLEWDGRYFKRTRTGLRDLGLRVQLGHPLGVMCPQRKAAANDFVLYDLTGVHTLAVDFCACLPRTERRTQLLCVCWWPATVKEPNTCATFALLKLFQILNCLDKLSAYDFLRGLEMMTNHDGLDKPPDCRRPFMHIIHQWREVKCLKQFKRGHAEGGQLATEQGGLALPCRACPQPGRNLPEGSQWENIPIGFRFLYFLFLAQDANFRLVNRNVSSEEADPILGDGFGYFAKREGEDGYKVHIQKHTTEEEISSCSGFQAMSLANKKQVKGLQTSGIAEVMCSRHNMWRANGMGDLQVRERYCNLDFLLLSTLVGFLLMWLVTSYNIACQYGVGFWDRMLQFPDCMQLKISDANVRWKGVEQNWLFSNGAAASTRLMGPGSRHATLEDVLGFHNYKHQLAMRRWFLLREANKHKVALDAFTEGLESTGSSEGVAEWQKAVEKWEEIPHRLGEKMDCPFTYKEAVTTLRDIQLVLAKEELISTEDGVEVEQESTPSSFVSMGLAMEDQQRVKLFCERRLEINIKGLKDPLPTQKLGFVKRRTGLLKRIHRFCQLQLVYMPALQCFLMDVEKQVVDRNGEQTAEATRLFLPSKISDAKIQGRACARGLPEVEARMREGETGEALEKVREGLRSRMSTNRFRITNHMGQGALTRGQGILRQIEIKVHLAKVHYWYAHAGLLALRGHGVWEERLKVLRDEDMRGLNERALAEEEVARENQVDELTRALAKPAGRVVAEGIAAGEGSHSLLGEDTDPKLHEALRVEWCRAYSRSRRLEEEVRLLREEMRCTIAYSEVAAREWAVLAAEEGNSAGAELGEGRRAYAAEKADRERDTCAALRKNWAGILAKADQYLDGMLRGDDEEVTVSLDPADELELEEEEVRLEAEWGEGEPL